jgi:hypothetical protein
VEVLEVEELILLEVPRLLLLSQSVAAAEAAALMVQEVPLVLQVILQVLEGVDLMGQEVEDLRVLLHLTVQVVVEVDLIVQEVDLLIQVQVIVPEEVEVVVTLLEVTQLVLPQGV